MEVVVILGIIGGAAWWLLRRRSASADPRSTPLPSPQRAALMPSSPVRAGSHRGAGAPAHWYALGQAVELAGLRVAGGLYVGESLEAITSFRGPDPALINPRLPVNLRRPDLSGQAMGYWPSYTAITPAARGAYLRWLAGGRPGGAYIGYVFLYFYGIERRVILDAQHDEQARAEVPALLVEVERLLGLYKGNNSFRGYAGDFLAMSHVAALSKRVSELEPPGLRQGWELPLEVKLAVGAFAMDGEPIPGRWALAWALNSPDIYLRTPARRCEQEFAEMFLSRYTARYGGGARLSPGRTPLQLHYRPASASFGGSVELDCGGLPDVSRQPKLTRELAAIVDEVTDQLDAYSRYVGRHNETNSPRAVALLPPELAAGRAPVALHTLIADVTATPSIFPTQRVAGLLGSTPGKLAKADAATVSALLAAQGVALEPDVRHGTINFSRHASVVLWRDTAAAAAPSEGFAAATVLLHLGVTISGSDGEISAPEERELEAALAHAFELASPERRRLGAHLAWLLKERPGIAGVKARIAPIPDAQRRMIAHYLLAVAAADGVITAGEVDSLRRLYGLLGLESESVHSDLHGLAAAGPVPVIAADRDPGDFALPSPYLLDPQRLEQVLSSTREVSEVLTGVFADDRADAGEQLPAQDAAAEPSDPAGLDCAHAALVRRLAAQQSWSRGEFDALADELGLFPAGAIETVNEAAFELTDGPLLENGDLIELDGHVLKVMLA
ncbi:MAG: TerB N-terminal domain-containing protein [Solirubrobacteraceae bacterium]